jgi:hypothetical protein
MDVAEETTCLTVDPSAQTTTTETCNKVLFNDKIYAYNIIVCLIVGYSLIAVDMMSLIRTNGNDII